MSSNKVDRLSSLPAELVSRVLSLMPTRFAVRTSILSKRWRYKWTLVTNLDFDDHDPDCLSKFIHQVLDSGDVYPFYDLDCLSKFVDRVLELCSTPQVKLFRLCFSKIRVPRSSVSKWISDAVRLKVCELDIQVIQVGLPSCLFTCNTLTKLRLDCSDDVWECPSPVSLPCMKTLDIAVYRNFSVNASKLICACPLLESLSLKIALRYEEDYNFNFPTLKRLKLKTTCFSPPAGKIILNVPNLEYLFVGGAIYLDLMVEDLSSLVEADISTYRAIYVYQLLELVKAISRAKSLSLPPTWFISSLPKFPNLEHLELKDSVYGWREINQILQNSSELEHLCIYQLRDIIWTGPVSVPACLLTNLRTMKFLNCKGRESEIKLLEFMLGNAKVLETLTIKCECPKKVRLLARLLKFPRASMNCKIHFVEK